MTLVYSQIVTQLATRFFMYFFEGLHVQDMTGLCDTSCEKNCKIKWHHFDQIVLHNYQQDRDMIYGMIM